MNDNQARIEQFKTEIGELKLRGSSSEGEKRLLVIGILLVAAGVGLAVLGAVQVGNSGGSPADQRAFMAQGSFMGLALVVAGAALFVRYSLARYLRFWLVRMTYESRANTDRLVDAIERAAGLPPSASQPAVLPPEQRAAAPSEPAPIEQPAAR